METLKLSIIVEMHLRFTYYPVVSRKLSYWGNATKVILAILVARILVRHTGCVLKKTR